jgi:predicted PurR-regulated permease PerM
MYTVFMSNFSDSKHTIRIAPQTIFLVIASIMAVVFIFRVWEILIVLFLSFVFMAALHPGVKLLQKRLRLPKAVAILLMYLVVLLIVGTLFAMIIPPLAAELPNFLATLPVPSIPDDIRHLRFTISDLSTFISQIRTSLGAVITIIATTASGVLTMFTVLVMSVYLIWERDHLHKKVIWFSREKHHIALAKELLDEVEVQLGGWVRGEIFLMFIVGAMTYIGLALLGIPYALPLGILAGLLEVLPNLGPVIAAVPAFLIAYFAVSPAMGAFTILFSILVQQLENHLIVPKIMKDNVDVNPLVTILVILVGFKLGNFLGALLAVPIYIVIRASYSMWLREKGMFIKGADGELADK